MKMICRKCNGSREVNKTEYDSFSWQCQSCGKRYQHKAKKEKTVNIKIDPVTIDFNLTRV